MPKFLIFFFKSYAISMGLHIPSSLRIVQKRSSWRSFVRMSAHWWSLPINSSSMSPLCTWSLIKRDLISMCLVWECWIGFFVKLIALVLSHWIGMWSNVFWNPLIVVLYKEIEYNNYLLQHTQLPQFIKLWSFAFY